MTKKKLSIRIHSISFQPLHCFWKWHAILFCNFALLDCEHSHSILDAQNTYSCICSYSYQTGVIRSIHLEWMHKLDVLILIYAWHYRLIKEVQMNVLLNKADLYKEEQLKNNEKFGKRNRLIILLILFSSAMEISRTDKGENVLVLHMLNDIFISSSVLPHQHSPIFCSVPGDGAFSVPAPEILLIPACTSILQY